MIQRNEFYLSKEGKACHIDFSHRKSFFALGATILKQSSFFIQEYIQNKLLLRKFYSSHGLDYSSKNSGSLLQSNLLKVGILGIAVSMSSYFIYQQYFNSYIEKTVTPIIHVKNNNAPKEIKFPNSVFESKKEAFANLLMVTEGKSNTFYKDNSGIAVGYGWNPTKNTKIFNAEVAKAIGLNPKEEKAIMAVSANNKVQNIPKNLKDMVFTDKQLQKSVKVMMNAYEKEFLNVLKFKANEKSYDFEKLKTQYQKLPYNQQAVLLHMTFKVGAKNLLQYHNFFDALFVYLENPTKKNLKETSTHFEYFYKTRTGEVKRDTRVEDKHIHFFKNCLQEKIKLLDNIKSCKVLSVEETKSVKMKNG